MGKGDQDDLSVVTPDIQGTEDEYYGETGSEGSLLVTAAKFIGAGILLAGVAFLGYYLGHPDEFE